jgi:hypothetical protein
MLSKKHLSAVNAELHNLVKLPEALVDGRLLSAPGLPVLFRLRELIIY